MFTHLGNVRATFADKRLASVNGSSIDDYSIDVTSWSDYYAFGAQMPKRNDNPGDYRYGFNGMESDEEVKDASGTSYDFGARMYDPRVGRWLSTDPKAEYYLDLSPYVAFANNALRFIDPGGETLRVAQGEKIDITFLSKLLVTQKGELVLNTIINSPNVATIKTHFGLGGNYYVNYGSRDKVNPDDEYRYISYDPYWNLMPLLEGGSIDEFLKFSHELYHAYQDVTGRVNMVNGKVTNSIQMESQAVRFGNYLRDVYGYIWSRNRYGNVDLFEVGTDFNTKDEVAISATSVFGGSRSLGAGETAFVTYENTDKYKESEGIQYMQISISEGGEISYRKFASKDEYTKAMEEARKTYKAKTNN